MVTSDEERKGSERGAPLLAANDAHEDASIAPEPLPDPQDAAGQALMVEGDPRSDKPPEVEAAAPAEETGEPPTPEVLAAAPIADNRRGEAPAADEAPFWRLDMAVEDEDEATGRRVESLLAEAPDGDPEGPSVERGEGMGEPEALEGFALDPVSAAEAGAPEPPEDDPASSPAFHAAPAEPVATIVDPSFYEPVRPGPARPLRGGGMNRVGPIVAFDFDGTLTVRDSFTAFLKWREGSGRYHAEMAALAPAALRYLFDRDPGKLKAAAVRRFLAGLPRQLLNEEAMEFATVSAPLLFRPDALRAWRRYRQDGARLLIVTASPENIVAPFARGLGADMLIATQLIFDQEDRVQGGLMGDNCRGPEKVRRIRAALGDDVVLAAAYGDTDGDWDMLDMAEQQFMRLFVGVPGKPAGPG